MSQPSPCFEVPTVDIGPYLRDASSDAAADVVRAIRIACTDSGFFQVVNHGISRELQDSVHQAARALFALPLEEKTKLIHPTLTNRGYELIGSQVLQADGLPDLKEVRRTRCPTPFVPDVMFTDYVRGSASGSTWTLATRGSRRIRT